MIFQVPHHGSETGWDAQYLCKSGLNSNSETSAIIQFGYGNKYGHPKPNVIVDLVNKSFDLHFCNQFEFFSYHIDLQF
jgi:beta-lactamase superfamily II metal-dependent hydrolase